MDSDEQIVAHIVSVWREARGFLTIGGKEGMLILTNKHLMFITKTESKLTWWKAVVPRQIVALLRSKNVMIRHDGYEEKNLRSDLENEKWKKKNVEISFDNISKMKYEEKDWGDVLYLEYNLGEKKEKHQFSVVQDWVKYPAKAPMKYLKINWSPIIDYIKERQKFTE